MCWCEILKPLVRPVYQGIRYSEVRYSKGGLYSIQYQQIRVTYDAGRLHVQGFCMLLLKMDLQQAI